MSDKNYKGFFKRFTSKSLRKNTANRNNTKRSNITRRSNNKINFNKSILYSGPICDPIGFFQQTAKCWINSVQMLFTNTDGIKEIVQPILVGPKIIIEKDVMKEVYNIYESSVNFVRATSEPDKLPRALILNSTIISFDNFNDNLQLFINTFQKRFRRHYIQTKSFHLENKTNKYRTKGSNVLTCELSYKKSTGLTPLNIPGAILIDVIIFFFILRKIFNVNIDIEYVKNNNIDTPYGDVFISLVKSTPVSKISGVLCAFDKHISCFFYCNKKGYYYNATGINPDGNNIIEFPVNEWFQLIESKKGELSFFNLTIEGIGVYHTYPVFIVNDTYTLYYPPQKKIITQKVYDYNLMKGTIDFAKGIINPELEFYIRKGFTSQRFTLIKDDLILEAYYKLSVNDDDGLKAH
jgi:hypothetical protein